MAYDLSKRKQFETVGDLKELFKDVPDETPVYIIGTDGWFHIEEDKSAVCLDCEELADCYGG